MDLGRAFPILAALLLAVGALGPAMADHTEYESAEAFCEDRTDDPEEQEQCEDSWREAHSDDGDSDEWQAPEESEDSDSDTEDDPHRDWERSSEEPMFERIPADAAPHLNERAEFFQEMAQEHREFHEELNEERRTFFGNQTAERRDFVQALAEDCLNETAREEHDVENMTAEELRELFAKNDDDRIAECMKDLRAFLMEQQEKREAFLEDQREAHESFHEDMEDEREAFLAEQREEDRERAQRGHQQWRQEHAEAEAMGDFEARDGSVDGRYVTFNYTSEPAALADVTVMGIPVFEAAALDADGRALERGAGFMIKSDDGHIRIHDNPAVALLVTPRDGTTWTLDVAAHLDVNATEDDERWRLRGTEFTGYLLFADDPSYDDVNSTFRGDEPVRFVHVPAEPEAGPGGGDEGPGAGPAEAEADIARERSEALAKGTLGAEVTLSTGEDAALEDETVVFDDLEVTLEETEPGKVRFVVDGELDQGRTVIVNAGPGIFESQELAVTYYDLHDNGTEEEVPIRLASDVQDIMDPNDDSTPEYLPARGADGWQVMVSVPTFSAHAVEIQSLVSEAPPSVVAGVLGAVGFLLVAGGNLFRQRP